MQPWWAEFSGLKKHHSLFSLTGNFGFLFWCIANMHSRALFHFVQCLFVQHSNNSLTEMSRQVSSIPRYTTPIKTDHAPQTRRNKRRAILINLTQHPALIHNCPSTSKQHSVLLELRSENVGVRGQTTVSRHMLIPECFCLLLQAHFLSLPPYMLFSLPFLGALAFTFLWQQTQSVCRLARCRLLPWQPVSTNSHHFHMLE